MSSWVDVMELRPVLIYLGRRGAGNWISYEIAYHLGQKLDLLVVLSRQSEYFSKWQSVPVKQIATDTYLGFFQALTSLVFPMRIKRLGRQILDFRPNVLLFPMFHPWNPILQRLLTNVPSVVFVHDPEPHPDITGRSYGILENVSIRQATRCIVMSEALKPILVSRGIPAERIDVVPLGMPRGLSSILVEGQEKKKRRQIPTVLFFGRIAPYKGLEYLLYAIINIARKRPIHLLLVGDGNLQPFRSLLNLIPSVETINRWVDEDEIPAIFLRADLLVLPYTSASQSGVIPLAAAFSLPVIATQTGGIPEQIRHGYSGWLVPPASSQALEDMIFYVLEHPDEAREVGQHLQDEYMKRSWYKISQMILRSMEKAVKGE